MRKCRTIYFTRRSLLITCWILGLLFGLLLTRRPPINSLIAVRSTIIYCPHLVISILYLLLPFITTYVVSKFYSQYVFYLFFFRACFFGALLGFLLFSFGSASWLAWFLYLFSNSACAALYIMFFTKENLRFKRFLRYTACVVLIAIFNHIAIESISSAITFL